MKLLFDQNLPPRLVDTLGDLFPGSSHVQMLGLERVSDEALWTFARDNGFSIVTKDVDFSDRNALCGHPPKIVWIRLGNCTTAEIEAALRRHGKELENLDGNQDIGVIAIFG